MAYAVAKKVYTYIYIHISAAELVIDIWNQVFPEPAPLVYLYLDNLTSYRSGTVEFDVEHV